VPNDEGDAKPHLKALEEIERECLLDLVRVLRKEGLEAIRYTLWDMTKWHRDYDPCVWRDRATEEHNRQGWEKWVRMDRIMCAVPRGAHERQAEEAMGALEDGPGRFYKSYPD
jgi:hypothetical protein